MTVPHQHNWRRHTYSCEGGCSTSMASITPCYSLIHHVKFLNLSLNLLSPSGSQLYSRLNPHLPTQNLSLPGPSALFDPDLTFHKPTLHWIFSPGQVLLVPVASRIAGVGPIQPLDLDLLTHQTHYFLFTTRYRALGFIRSHDPSSHLGLLIRGLSNKPIIHFTPLMAHLL